MIYYVTVDPTTCKRTILNDGIKPDPDRPHIELVEMSQVVHVYEYDKMKAQLEIERTFNRKIIEVFDRELIWENERDVTRRMKILISKYELERDQALKK